MRRRTLPNEPVYVTAARPDLYSELLQLTRGVGAIRLALADGLDRLDAMNGFQKLGYPGLDSYGRERLGRSGRWLGDARALNRRLLMLPVLRAAYLVGMISTSKVELLSTHLVKSGDLDEVAQRRALHLANELSVRELREHCRARTSDSDDEQRPPVQLTRTVTRLDAALFEGAVKLLGALGASTRKEAVEAMLAEAMVSLLDLVPKDSEVRADLLARWARPSWLDDPRSDLPMSGDEQNDPTAQVQDLDDEDLPEAPSVPPDLGQLPADLSLADLDQALRRLSAELTRRDLRLGELALEAERTGLVASLGCPDPATFYREHLGVAPSSMAARMALARRIPRLPALEAAILRGDIGFEAATLIARVATILTECDWLALANRSTVKQLREAIDAAELNARVDGTRLDRLDVPTEDQLEDARDLERTVLSVAFEPARPMSGDATPEADPDLGTVPLRLTLPPDVADLWHDLECLLGELDPEADFVPFLTHTTLATWRGTAPKVAYHHVYLRDRYMCQNPVCRSRSVSPHHIVFRAHGGSEAPTNLVALCERCHLDLVHGGHLKVTGLAPHALTWRTRADARLRA